MTSATHTPGPWLYRPQEHDDWGYVRGGPDNFGQHIVAIARPGRFVSEGELSEHRRNKTDPYEANARLIAAAPDLLEALEFLIAGLPNEPNEVGMYALGAVSATAIDDARAALSRARGEP